MRSKILNILSLAGLTVFALVGIADAVVIGNLTISGDTSPNVGSTVNFSGSCGLSGANGTVTVSVVSGASTTVLGSTTANAAGNFNGSVTVPSNLGSGPATLVATCSTNDTVTGQLDIMVPTGTDLSLSGSVGLGGTVSVSGVCGTVSSGSTVNVSLVSGGTTTNLGSTTTVGANGDFSGSFVIPTTVGPGPATIVVTCPSSGNIITAAVNISDPNASLTVTNNNPAIGNEIRFSGVCGTVAGQEVEISIVQAGSSVLIGRVITTSDGVFSGTLTIPDATFTVGPATLQVECPAGNVVNVAITLTPDNDAGGVPTAPGAGSAPTGGTAAGGGEAVSTTPTGGVAAGTGTAGGFGWLLVILALIAGTYAYAYSPKALLNN